MTWRKKSQEKRGREAEDMRKKPQKTEKGRGKGEGDNMKTGREQE